MPMPEKGDKQIEFYEEGMKIEKGKRYAFIFSSDIGNTKLPDDNKPIAMQATEGKGYNATIVIGDKFMKGVFVAAEELKKVYRGWNNTLHDLNHMGSGYAAGFTIIPADVSYHVGHQDGLTYNETTKAVQAKIHIDKDSKRYDEWESYANICNQIKRPINLSMFCYYGEIRWMKARDLPKDSGYRKQGYKADDTVPCMFNILPYMVSTVTRGACDDKDGCGIDNSNSNLCEDNKYDVGTTEHDETENETNPEDAKKRAYLEKRVKQMKRK
jgi:hypothetical protein